MATGTPAQLNTELANVIKAINARLPGRSKKELLEILLLYVIKEEVGSSTNIATFNGKLDAAATQYDTIGRQFIDTFKTFQTPNA